MEPLPYVYLFAPACALILVLIWRDAKRAGYAADRVAAAMAACAAGAVIGSKVLMFDFHAAQYGEKTFLGAVVGGAVTLAIVLKVLQFDSRAFDVPVLPVLWGHALGRVGCFVSGCCHGVETSAAWGVQYAWLPAPVHPTQLYESALDVVLAVVLTRHRARFEKPASLALTGAVGIALVRFIVEPWRASAVPGPIGLTVVQASTLAVMVVALTTLALRERVAAIPPKRLVSPEWERSALVLVGVVIVAMTTRAWLTPLETLLVASVVTCAAFVVLRRAMPRIAVASPVFGFAVIAPLQSPDSLPRLEAISWHAIGTSVALGGFEVTTEDCDGNTLTTQDHFFKTIGVSAETYRQEYPGVGLGARLSAFTGLNTAPPPTCVSSCGPNPQPSNDEVHDRYSGATFAGTADGKWIGATLGFATGRWALRSEYPIFGALDSRTIPVGGVRIGRLVGKHFSLDIGTHQPSFAPGPFVRVGFGKGDTLGRLFRFGFEENGAFATGRIVSKAGVELEPYLALGNRYSMSLSLKKRFYRKP